MFTLEDILSIPTYSRNEIRMQEYLLELLPKIGGLTVSMDGKGNIYTTKGKTKGHYPCVMAHMDTVHSDQTDIIANNQKLNLNSVHMYDKEHIYAFNPITYEQTGIGGDDKCGVYICLRLLQQLDVVKAVFFVEEEIGMRGSEHASEEFFDDVAYAIQFDAPTGNYYSITCSGVQLWDEDYHNKVLPILESNNIDNFTRDPFTDVVQVRKKFGINCSVVASGYYKMHTSREYVIREDVDNAVKIGREMINELGEKRY